MRRNWFGFFVLVACLFVFTPSNAAQTQQTQGVKQSDAGTADEVTLEKVHSTRPPYSPYVGRNFPTRPLFGDTHLHTAFSMDAGAFGARLTPNDAYRFARGEEINSNTGQPVKLSRPLDFLVVADHSDGFGFFPQLMGGDPVLLPRRRVGNGMTRSSLATAPRPLLTSSRASDGHSCPGDFHIRALAHIPTALLFFSMGVETGHFMFIGAVLCLIALVRHTQMPIPRWSELVPAYAIGSCAAFWFIQRTFSFLPF